MVWNAVFHIWERTELQYVWEHIAARNACNYEQRESDRWLEKITYEKICNGMVTQLATFVFLW
jgi:hypothetical protein